MLSSFQARLVPGVNAGFQPGVYKRTYTGYFGGVTTWFATATLTATNKIVGSINDAAVSTNTSYQFLGYFKAPYSETFTFNLSSDDQSYFWLASPALNGNFNAGNAFLSANVGMSTGGWVMTAGEFYAFRIQVGNGAGPGSIGLSVSSPSLALTSDLTSLTLFNPNTLGI